MGKEKFHEIIRNNIERTGFHITQVASGTSPRWAYTIGLRESYNIELVFAGGVYYLAKQLDDIFHQIISEIIKQNGNFFDKIDLGELGTFSLQHVDQSWSKRLMLGVYDYYQVTEANVFQIVPDEEHLTLDVPDMSNSFDTAPEPVWQWLEKDWDLGVPEKSTVVCNVEVLMGVPILELTRWEEDYWEMFSEEGPEVENSRKRVVSIGTIIAIDPSVAHALNLPLEKGFMRDSVDDDWRNWG